MAPLLPRRPDADRRWVLRVPPDPHLPFDTCDYSLDPALVSGASKPGSPTARSSTARCSSSATRLPGG